MPAKVLAADLPAQPASTTAVVLQQPQTTGAPTGLLGTASGSEIGTIAAVLVAAAAAFAKFAPKLGLERKEAAASNLLIDNLTKRVDALTTQYATAQAERERLFAENATMQARMRNIEEVENRNADLNDLLKRRDDQIQQLIDALQGKNDELNSLRERIHELELRLTQRHNYVCSECQQNRPSLLAPTDFGTFGDSTISEGPGPGKGPGTRK